MSSARKRDARSPKPRGPARTPHAEESNRGARGERREKLSLRALRLLLIAGAVTLVAILWFFRGRAAQADLEPIAKQNVLLVTIDTLRADALGCYGGPAATPALDRLAAEGVRFDFAHAHAVLTLPSHASILTGMYPFQHGIRD